MNERASSTAGSLDSVMMCNGDVLTCQSYVDINFTVIAPYESVFPAVYPDYPLFDWFEKYEASLMTNACSGDTAGPFGDGPASYDPAPPYGGAVKWRVHQTDTNGAYLRPIAAPCKTSPTGMCVIGYETRKTPDLWNIHDLTGLKHHDELFRQWAEWWEHQVDLSDPESPYTQLDVGYLPASSNSLQPAWSPTAEKVVDAQSIDVGPCVRVTLYYPDRTRVPQPSFNAVVIHDPRDCGGGGCLRATY